MALSIQHLPWCMWKVHRKCLSLFISQQAHSLAYRHTPLVGNLQQTCSFWIRILSLSTLVVFPVSCLSLGLHEFAVIDSHLPRMESQCITGGRLSLCHSEPIVAQEQHRPGEVSQGLRACAGPGHSHLSVIALGQALDAGLRVRGDVEAPL